MNTLQLRVSRWTLWHLVAAVVLTALGVAARYDAWVDIVSIAWRDEEASHVFLVPVVVAWLLWVRRVRVSHLRLSGSYLGPVLAVIGWLVSSFGYRHSIQSFWHGGAVLIVVGCVLAVLGTSVLIRFLPVFAVLVFAVPVPGMIRQQIALPLETGTAQITQKMCDLLGIMVDRSGNLLSINGVPVTIAEACNGLRMVFALALVSYAFAFGMPLRGYVRLMILAASPFSAILCNVMRLVPTLLLYGYGPRAAAQLFHDLSGWLMLGVAFLFLMAIMGLLRWALLPVTPYPLAYNQ